MRTCEALNATTTTAAACARNRTQVRIHRFCLEQHFFFHSYFLTQIYIVCVCGWIAVCGLKPIRVNSTSRYTTLMVLDIFFRFYFYYYYVLVNISFVVRLHMLFLVRFRDGHDLQNVLNQ